MVNSLFPCINFSVDTKEVSLIVGLIEDMFSCQLLINNDNGSHLNIFIELVQTFCKLSELNSETIS